MIDVTLITCTGYRKEALELCHRWVQSFDLKGLTADWVIVDDEATEFSRVHGYGQLEKLTVVPGAGAIPKCSMPINLHNALGYCQGRALLIIEDDDWYGTDYVTQAATPILEGDAISGFKKGRYFHLPTRTFAERVSQSYSSLCRTAVSQRHKDRLRQIAWSCATSNQVNVDLLLWGGTHKALGKSLQDDCSCVSIKGVPGRGSAGQLGRKKLNYPDPDLLTLRSWIGDDVDLYLEREMV